ncbi:acyl carrier protein [Methylobacterium sp. A49B]
MQQFREGMAEILEISSDQISPTLELKDFNWDSIAIVSTIVLIDECYNFVIEGADLVQCETIGDIEKVIETARR